MNKENLIILTSLGCFLREVTGNDKEFNSMFTKEQEGKFIAMAFKASINGKETKEMLVNLIKEYINKA